MDDTTLRLLVDTLVDDDLIAKQSPVKCSLCLDKGYTWVIDDDERGPVQATCRCKWGKK